MHVDQERQEEGVKEIVQAGADLRWAGHRLQGLNVCLNARYEDTIAKLKGRCDLEARKIVLELLQEFQKHNNELAALCMRLSNSHHGAMDLLKKSEDGRAAVTMRRAAELLVKVRFSGTRRSVACFFRVGTHWHAMSRTVGC